MMFNFLKKLVGNTTDLASILAGGAIILDVRTKNEFDAGHIQGSRNIPLDKIKSQAEKLKSLNKPVITVCRSGSRSGMAKSILSGAGVEVYNGGSWQAFKNKYAIK